ncbi:MAG TPA: hypothetical protein PLW35_00015 [Verrucomicrobiota bacterium]|nr:hypothetical protein [Verrucomicrobiota bacterium]
MQLKTVHFTFTLLTPCFSGTALGKQDNHAEMRIPPIRGHVRFWHRTLFGSENCNTVWGSASGDKGKASVVALRFVGPVSQQQASPKAFVLPHKPAPQPRQPDFRGPRPALAAEQQFVIELQRLVGCNESDWLNAQRALKAWLLLGCLGLRSNRAAGSVWPVADWVPTDRDSLKAELVKLGLRNLTVALIGLGKNKTPAQLRETASDTIQGNPHQRVFGGIKPERHPSPTKFKVIRLGQQYCLLAWAPDTQIVGNDSQRRLILTEAKQLLSTKPNRGRWLALGEWDYIFP